MGGWTSQCRCSVLGAQYSVLGARCSVLGVEVRGPLDDCPRGSQRWRSGVQLWQKVPHYLLRFLTTSVSAKASILFGFIYVYIFKSSRRVYQILFLGCYFFFFFLRLWRVNNGVLINTALFSLHISLNNCLCEEDKYSMQTQQSESTKPIISCLPLQQTSEPVPPHPLRVPQHCRQTAKPAGSPMSLSK